MLVSISLGQAYYFTSDVVYRAHVTLIPNESYISNSIEQAGILEGTLLRLSGLNKTKMGFTKINLGFELLKSRSFFCSLLDERFIIELLNSKKIVSAFYNAPIGDKSSDDGCDWEVKDGSENVNVLELHKTFLQSIKYNRNVNDDFINIYVSNESPEVAQKWLIAIVSQLNTAVKNRYIELSKSKIENVNRLLNQSVNVGVKNKLTEYKLTEIRKLELIKVEDDFMVQTIAKPFLPDEKYNASWLLILVSSLSGGLVLICVQFMVFLLFKR